MSDQKIALYKQPDVHPVGVGETWTLLYYRILLKVAGPESTMDCQDDHLCAGLKAGNDGAIHGVQDLRKKNRLRRNGVFYS